MKKKMTKCVALLAFILAFVSCDNATDNPDDPKKAPTVSGMGTGTIIKTKADLTKSVKNIIKEYYNFALEIGDRNSNSRAVAATKDEVANQLKDIFDVIYRPFDDKDMGMSIVKLVLFGEGADKDVKLEGKIDLANIKPSVGVDAYIELINHAYGKIGGETPNYTRETYFGDNYRAVNDFIGVADKYASIPKLYAFGKLDVNANNASNYASAAAKFDVEVEATNINNLIPELFTTYNNNIGKTYIPTSVDLPIMAIKRLINLDASVALSKKNYEAWVDVIKTLPGRGDEPEWNFQYPDFSYPDYDETIHGEYWEYWEERDRAEQEWWEERWHARNEYEEKWEAEWEEYRTKYRKELKNHFASASYPGTFSGKIGEGVSLTVAGRTNAPGGIITLSLDASYTSPAKVLAFAFTVMYNGWWALLDDYGYDYKGIIRGLKNDYGFNPTITVTDYTGNQTLKLEIDDIISVIDDIVNNFGEIIQ